MSGSELEHVDSLAVMSRGLSFMREDPQRYFTCSSLEQRRFLAELRYGEIYLHSGNKWGKTTIGARVGVALARCSRSLDGVELPSLPNPNVGIVLSLDYKQQRLSVQPAYLAAVGDWPHTEEWNGNTLVSMRIKPEGSRSENPRDWSLVIFFSQENRRSGIGARGNWVHADEPPREDVWREVRKMGEAGTVFVSFITATSLKRSQWYWLRDDYPIEMEGRWASGYLRLRAPAFNPDDPDDMSVGNIALTPDDRRELLDKYRSDPHRLARITGLEIDTTGQSPWRVNYEELRRWLERAEPGEWQEWKVSREIITHEGKRLVSESVDVEIFEEHDSSCTYRVIADPSSGVDDDDHDPGMAQVLNMTHGTQAARYNGFIGEYGLGVLCAGFSREYGDARVDPAVTGGWGSAFLTGLRAGGCRSVVSHTTTMLKAGEKLERVHVGFVENKETRPMYAAAIREALVASEQGAPWIRIRCKEDILQLMDLQMDGDGKIIHEDGDHDEAFAVLGRWASLMLPRGARHRVERPTPRQALTKSPIVALRERIGADVRRGDRYRTQVPKAIRPRPAPR